jgi:hypothetical protein
MSARRTFAVRGEDNVSPVPGQERTGREVCTGRGLILGRLRKEFEENTKYVEVPMADYGRADITDLSYTKGMLFFALLHEIVGEEKFFAAMGSFQQKFRATGATTADFTKHLESELGRSVGALIEDWVYGTQSSRDIAAGLTFGDLLAKYAKRPG